MFIISTNKIIKHIFAYVDLCLSAHIHTTSQAGGDDSSILSIVYLWWTHTGGREFEYLVKSSNRSKRHTSREGKGYFRSDLQETDTFLKICTILIIKRL